MRTNGVAVAALLLFDLTLVINLYNIGAIFSLMAPQFNVTVAGLGLLGSAFILGRAILELPGSVLALRYGPRKLLMCGGLMSSIPIFLSAFSGNFWLIVVLRCVAGAGLGVSFPQVMTLVVRNVREGAAGLGVGLVFLTSNVAGIFGLFGWAEIGAAVGWRSSLLLSGGLGFVTTCALLWAVGKDDIAPSRKAVRGQVLKAVFDRRLAILAVALIGIGGGTILTWNFMVYYLQSTLGLGATEAGLIGGLAPAFALVAPLAGRGLDRYHRPRLWVGGSVLVLAIGLAVASIGTLAWALVSVILVGVAQGAGFTVVFATTREVIGSASELEPVAFGWVDTVSLLGPFLAPILFSFIVLQSGYPNAWIFGGVFTVVFVLPLLLTARKTR